MVRVVFLGVKGFYLYLVICEYFSCKNIELIEFNCDYFKEVVRIVEFGYVDYGVLLIENISLGFINEVYDLL